MLFICHRLFLFILCCLCVIGCDDVRDGMLKVHITGGDTEVEVTGIPPELVEMYKTELRVFYKHEYQKDAYEARLAKYLAYYTKYIDAGGIAIVGNRYVRDEQFYVAREVILHMTSKYPEMREPLSLKANVPAFQGYRVILVSREEPAESEFNSEFGRTHGFAAAFPEDPTFHGFGYATTYYCVSRMWWRQHYEDRIYLNLTPFIHEFAHALHRQGGVHLIYPDFDERLRHAYRTDVVPSDDGFVYSAHTNGYGSTNWLEYWAELTEDWFMDSPDKLTAFYKGVWKYDQLMLPIMEDLFPKIRLAPLDYLERPVEWDWDPDLILD